MDVTRSQVPLHFSDNFPNWFLDPISEKLADGFVCCAILFPAGIPVIPLGERMKKSSYSCIPCIFAQFTVELLKRSRPPVDASLVLFSPPGAVNTSQVLTGESSPLPAGITSRSPPLFVLCFCNSGQRLGLASSQTSKEEKTGG